jgi:hypothetical protein
MKQIVIMPGGFHPFHAGHLALYQSAVKAFPGAEVYVAASNDMSERPFPFAVKEKLAKVSGVPKGRFVQVKSPFRPVEIMNQYDPDSDVLIFVRSEKDRNEQPKPGGTKKDGSLAYFQPYTGKDLKPFSQHAYMSYLPTVEFGPGITSATEIRNAWPKLNDKRKLALVMSLYPATQSNEKLGKNVVAMLDSVLGGQQDVVEGSLEELANTSLKVKEPKDFVNTNDRKQVTYKVMKFKSGKDTYLINFTVKGAPAFGKKQNWNAVNVSFGVREEQDDYSFGDEINTDLTAKNKNQFLIYSTVINAVRKFITEYNTEIDEIIMQGAGERQEAIYQRFFQSAGKYFPGWHHNGKHSLVRDVPRQTGKKVKEQGVAETLLGNVLSWPEIVNKVNSAMKATGWKGKRQGDGTFMFSTKGQVDNEWYMVIIDNAKEGFFTYALGTVEDGDPYIDDAYKGQLPNTEASVSELMNNIREGFGLSEIDEGWKEKLGAAALAGSLALGGLSQMGKTANTNWDKLPQQMSTQQDTTGDEKIMSVTGPNNKGEYRVRVTVDNDVQEFITKTPPKSLEEDKKVDPVTDAVISFYKPVVNDIHKEKVDNYVDRARELLQKTDDPKVRSKLIDIFKKGKENPYIQGGIVTTVGAVLAGGILNTAQQMGLSPAQTNLALQAILNTVIPTVVSRINGKNWSDTIKYTLASAGIGTGIAGASLIETDRDPWGDQGNFAGDRPVNIGGSFTKRKLNVGDLVRVNAGHFKGIGEIEEIKDDQAKVWINSYARSFMFDLSDLVKYIPESIDYLEEK